MHPLIFLFGKSFRWLRTSAAAMVVVLFAGCTTINQQDRQVLLDHRVPAPVYQKMLHREPLALSEIAQLSARRVPPEFIIRYIDNSLAEYQLTTDDVLVLRSVGVSNKVIDYLLTTTPSQHIIVNRYPYWPASYTRPVIIHRHHRRR